MTKQNWCVISQNMSSVESVVNFLDYGMSQQLIYFHFDDCDDILYFTLLYSSSVHSFGILYLWTISGDNL